MPDDFTDPSRTIMFVFVLAALMLPLAIALLARDRSDGGAAQRGLSGKLAGLAGATVLVLGVVAALAYTALHVAWVEWVAEIVMSLGLSLLAYLSIRILALKGHAWAAATLPRPGATRVASLGNRARKNPVRRWMWLVAVVACAIGPVSVAARAWLGPAESGIDPIFLALFLAFSSLALVELAVLPMILGAMLAAPEPMVASGATELAQLYAEERRRRVLGMFWLVGVCGPSVLGILLALMAWIPALQDEWALIAIVGSSLLALLVASYSWLTMHGYARIAKLVAQLERSPAAEAGCVPVDSNRGR